MQFLDGVPSSSPRTPVPLPGLQRQYRAASFAQHRRPRINRGRVARSLDLSATGMAARGFGTSHDRGCNATARSGGFDDNNMDGVRTSGLTVPDGEVTLCRDEDGRSQDFAGHFARQVTGGRLGSTAKVRSVGFAACSELHMNVARIKLALAQQRPAIEASSLKNSSARAAHSCAKPSDGPAWFTGMCSHGRNRRCTPRLSLCHHLSENAVFCSIPMILKRIHRKGHDLPC